MGGRGKTPTVAYVAMLLIEAGERPAILSRGYRRRRPEEGVVIVSDGVHRRADVDRSGDEPLMLARNVPGAAVLVCDVRAVAAALAETVLGCTVHVLDDGFQHRSLERDIDLVIVTPDDLRDRRVPFGRLRSPVSALAGVDAVIVEGGTAAMLPARASAIDAERPRHFSLTRALGRPWWLEGTMTPPAVGDRVVAVAGIARPERFGSALERAGWQVERLMGFADHHAYSSRDLSRIADACAAASARAVLTTEKDAMRLLPLRPLPFAVAAVPLEIGIGPGDEFREFLIRRLGEVRACG